MSTSLDQKLWYSVKVLIIKIAHANHVRPIFSALVMTKIKFFKKRKEKKKGQTLRSRS